MEERQMKKLTALLFFVGVMVTGYAQAEGCPPYNYVMYTPVQGDGILNGGNWVANVPADEA